MKNNLYKIRAVADTEDDIFIDILIPIENSFLSLHELIVEAFNLNKMEMASFYLSNEEWDKGEEITLFKMEAEEGFEGPRSMEESTIEAIFNKGYSKILYLHDFLNLNIFYIEILESTQVDGVSQAQITHKLGTYKPKEFSAELTLESETLKDPVQDIMDEYDEDDFGGFEELDEDLY